MSFHFTIHKSFFPAFLVFLASFALTLKAQNNGAIQGKVTDGITNLPLEGANIFVVGTGLGATADSNGAFTLRNIPRGTYTLKASYIGYTTQELFEIRVESGVTSVLFRLEEQQTETKGVEIIASPFSKTSQNLVSLKTIGQEQIRSNPGGNFDISKVVQSLPGVSGSVGFRNDIIVRGGAPNENVFYLDGIETPVINHFATQGAGGGPTGIINSVFVQSVNFASSGFGSQYDNALSSVFDFELVSPNKERKQTEIIVSATEAGITLDMPLNKKKTVTGIFSMRYSYLQFLFKGIGLPFLPTYVDGFSKVEWQINSKNSLEFVGIGAIDRLTLNRPNNPTQEQLRILDGLPIINQNTATAGFVFKHLTPHGYFNIILSRNIFENQFYKDNDTLAIKRTFDYKSVEIENRLRVNVVSKLGNWRVGYGGVLNYATANNRTFNIIGPADTVRADNNVSVLRYGLYFTLSREYFSGRLKTTAGVRTDMNNLTVSGSNPTEALSPRGNFSFSITEKLSLNGSIGVYYKLPPYTILAFGGNGNLLNQNARYWQTVHYVIGLEYMLSPSSIISVDAFLKVYDLYPISVRNGISLANSGGNFGIFGNEQIQSIGKGRSYGMEIYGQKKLTNRLYGIASYTLYWSQFSNDLVANNSGYTRSAWDNRHLISITGGYQVGKQKQWIFAGKWRYLGPAPFTPWRTDAAALTYYANQGQGLLDYSQINGSETSGFSQVDIRVERRFNFTKWNLTVFIDIQNFFNTANKGTPDFTLARDAGNNFITPYQAVQVSGNQQARIPSIGIRARF